MNAAHATLGGIPLTNQEPVSWQETWGTTPYARTFIVHESNRGRLEAILGEPCELVIDSVRWQKIYPLKIAPTRFPFHVAVFCADLRWKWPRAIIVRSWNKFRRTGVRTFVQGNPIELAVFKDEYQYVEQTLWGGERGRKVTAEQVTYDVLVDLSRKCEFTWEARKFPTGSDFVVEELEIFASGDVALATALAHAPGCDVYVRRDGVVVRDDVTDYKATREALQDLIPTTAGGIVADVDYKHLRPKEIVVWFEKEVELRFDSVSEADRSSTDPSPSGEDMLMENVLPLPDPTTTIGGKQYGQGTWVPIYLALSAWNDDLASLGKSPAPPALTMENVRKYWFVLEMIYTALGDLTLSAAKANWSARIAVLRAHFRKTWMIPRDWMKRIRNLRPYRLGVLDPVSGMRGPAQAWSQYCVEPSSKMYVHASFKRDKNLKFYWLNVDGYPGDSTQTPTARLDEELFSKSPSPAFVHVVDQDVGVLHIEYKVDPYGMSTAIHPSQMADSATGNLQAPTANLRDQLKGVIARDGHVTGAVPIGLSDNFLLAIIITAMPLSPNDERRLFPVYVSPSAVGKIAGGITVSGGKGPAWNLLCPPSVLTAWYVLRNSKEGRQTAYNLFGFRNSGIPAALDDSGVTSDTTPPGYNIKNWDPSDGTLWAVAVAKAVAQWVSFTNAVEGSMATHIDGGVGLIGNMDVVKDSLGPDGRLLSEIMLAAARRPIDWTAKLPQFVRPVILRIPDMHA